MAYFFVSTQLISANNKKLIKQNDNISRLQSYVSSHGLWPTLVFTHHQVQGQICAQLNNRNIQEMEKNIEDSNHTYSIRLTRSELHEDQLRVLTWDVLTPGASEAPSTHTGSTFRVTKSLVITVTEKLTVRTILSLLAHWTTNKSHYFFFRLSSNNTCTKAFNISKIH